MTIYTPDEIMKLGLQMVGRDHHMQQRVQRSSNVRDFQDSFGSSPLVCALIWEDLNATEVASAQLLRHLSPDKFLMAMFFLKRYPVGKMLAGRFKVCAKTASKWAWYFATKIQALKEKKIVWPAEWTEGHPNFRNTPTFLYSVDGVHCRTPEYKHETLAKNTKLYSHKFHAAGVNYELALSIFTNALVWMKGPVVASRHDVSVFREGLKDKTPQGKRGIADKGYNGEKVILSVPNSSDEKPLSKFKGRARARQESFNAKIKTFGVLAQNFCHSMEQHKICFEAVCVIVQYKLENGEPLYDV